MPQDVCREHGCPDEERYRDKEYLCVGCEEVDGWTSGILVMLDFIAFNATSSDKPMA